MGKCKMGIRNAYFNILGATYARDGGSQPKWILFFVHTHMLMYKHIIFGTPYCFDTILSSLFFSTLLLLIIRFGKKGDHSQYCIKKIKGNLIQKATLLFIYPHICYSHKTSD